MPVLALMGRGEAAPNRFPTQSGKKRKRSMKFSWYSKVAALVLLLLPVTNVLAATDTHKGGLSIGSAVQVGGTQLQAGDYALKWDGAGPNVQVSIIRSGKVVATVPARVV